MNSKSAVPAVLALPSLLMRKMKSNGFYTSGSPGRWNEEQLWMGFRQGLEIKSSNKTGFSGSIAHIISS